ncbi:hypothetical protein SAMN02910435_02406 [Ruminococcaceae bacterium D5]|nr:hypothetical protein SAMN02910435_02406 [Ruminococcaceae bacterium D5]
MRTKQRFYPVPFLLHGHFAARKPVGGSASVAASTAGGVSYAQSNAVRRGKPRGVLHDFKNVQNQIVVVQEKLERTTAFQDSPSSPGRCFCSVGNCTVIVVPRPTSLVRDRAAR